MNILDKLTKSEYWNQYLIDLDSKEDFKDKRLIKQVQSIINDGVEKISLKSFPLSIKKDIAKYKNSKKRTIYTYVEPYNTYLKMIHWLLQVDEKYSKQFCINSYAYQKQKSVSQGVRRLNNEIHKPTTGKYYIKTDFSDYFNSIKVDVLSSKMYEFFREEDYNLVEFMLQLLNEPNVYVNDKVVEIAHKGVMAGTPISGYLANIYMNEVDWEMFNNKIYYIRYADDVFILTNDVDKDLKLFEELITPLNVKLNMSKTETGKVADGFAVLGFYFKEGKIDIDEAKVQKMFSRIKRRSKWFKTWEKNRKVKNEVMVRTFIKGMNGKLYSRDEEDRMNWSQWYFPVINTTESLERIDAYMVQYIRYLISGKQLGYAKHSQISYEQVKKYGYRSLVNEFWRNKKKGGV